MVMVGSGSDESTERVRMLRPALLQEITYVLLVGSTLLANWPYQS